MLTFEVLLKMIAFLVRFKCSKMAQDMFFCIAEPREG